MFSEDCKREPNMREIRITDNMKRTALKEHKVIKKKSIL